MASKEFSAAVQTHTEAMQAYVVVRNAYRIGTVGDSEFLAARKVKTDADDALFDAEELEATREQV